MYNECTIEKIKAGFERFLHEHGRLPTALEIDKSNYLPSSRQIQRRFGGLEKLRSFLGYEDIHFGKGVFRSEIASRSNVRGRSAEVSLEKVLREKFGEVFVHTEKIFDDSKNRVDFYVFAPEENFGIDVFYTDTMHDLRNIINIKSSKYLNFTEELFLVVANLDFRQEELDEFSRNKQNKLPLNVSILSMETLLRLIGGKKSYPNPLVIGS